MLLEFLSQLANPAFPPERVTAGSPLWRGACSARRGGDSPTVMDISVIICTTNRANDLRDTLASLARVNRPGRVELLVVDNGSVDETKAVVEEAAKSYPFSLRYLYEAEPGKYAALNAGIRASAGRIIAATDDDARFEADWLERAVDGLSRYGCEFVGGRVRPLWGGPKPA